MVDELPYSGRNGLIKAKLGTGTLQTVGLMKSWDIEVTTQMWESTPMGLVMWKQFLLMGGSWTAQISGIWDVADDAGQKLFHDEQWGNSFLMDDGVTEVITDGKNGHPPVVPLTCWFYIHVGATSADDVYYTGDVLLTKYRVSNDAGRYPTLDVACQGNGKLKLFKGTTELDPIVPFG